MGAQRNETRPFSIARGKHRLEPFANIRKIPKLGKAALKFGSEAWVLKKREEQRLEAAQMKFLRHLLGRTKLDKEKKPMY